MTPQWVGTLRLRARRAQILAKPASRRTQQERFLLAGHNALLLDGLALSSESTVLDVGGYQGDYSAEIVSRYGCSVHMFEPVPAFARAAAARFAGDEHVHVHHYGLGPQTVEATFALDGDATSAVAVTPNSVPVQLRSVEEVFAELPTRIDVMTVNIEGGEYDLLRAMANAELLERVERLNLQFHQIGAWADSGVRVSRRLLAKTHRPLWCYDFVWECWVRRENQDRGKNSLSDDDALNTESITSPE